MGVEFELKYRASEKIQKTVIEHSQGPGLMITMETTYYDTPDGALEKLHYTLRRRLENEIKALYDRLARALKDENERLRAENAILKQELQK